MIHVSPTGGGGANGSEARPFPGIVDAQRHLRQLRKDGHVAESDPVTVLLAPGVYDLVKGEHFAEPDGGFPGAPVTYRAAKRGTVSLRGGRELAAADFAPVTDPEILRQLPAEARGKVLTCDLGKYLEGDLPEFPVSYQGTPVAPWLYVDGQPMTLARWPNKDADGGWVTFSEVVDNGMPQPEAKDPELRQARPGTFVFDHPRVARWDLEEGAWLFGYWNHDWADETIRIASHDPGKKTIRLAATHKYGVMRGTWGAKERRFYAINILAELDSPGEWFVDRKAKKLYYYPEKPLAQSELVLATNTDPMIGVRGASHIRFEGLNFGFHHGHGIVSKGGKGIEIVGCGFSNIAENGLILHGEGLTVRSCDFSNIGRSGITMDGGDRKTLAKSGNLVANNHIRDFGMFQRTYAPGIRLNGCGHTIRHNLIHDAPHSAIIYSGNEHLFELNEIHRVVMETGDAGAVYTGRDWTSQGNVLRHNYIHDLGSGMADTHTMGIYLDDCDSGDTLEGNVLFRAGRAIFIGGGRENSVLNNLVIDSQLGIHLDGRGMSLPQWNNNTSDPSWMLEKKAEAMDYRNPPWSERYPRLAKIMEDSPREPLYNRIRNNVFINCHEKVLHIDRDAIQVLHKLDIGDNAAVFTGNPESRPAVAIGAGNGVRLLENAPEDLGFGDFAGGDFSLREGAWLLEQVPGFGKIPFAKIGLQKDGHRPEP